MYQLDGGAPVTASAANGTGSAVIVPARLTNTLTVTAISAGGNYGQPASAIFNSAIGTNNQNDGDLSGDDIADLLTVGHQNSLAPGLWLAPGQSGAGMTRGDGTTSGGMTNIGVNGSGISTTGPTGLGTSSDFDGAIAFTGQFAGDGMQDGSTDWTGWTIATMQLPETGGTTGTAMFLWKKSTGELDLWENLSESTDANGAYNLTYTPYAIATGWNTGKSLTLQAADIDGDGTPDLWTVGSTAAGVAADTATSYLFANLSSSGPATVASHAVILAADTHDWPLDDAAGGNTSSTGTPAADDTGTLTLTGTTTTSKAADWSTKDVFDPDISMNGTTGSLVTSGKALNLSADFSLSVWAKPDATGGTILSQDGSTASGITLYPNTSDNQWYVCLVTADSATPAGDCSHGGNVALGAWTKLGVTYNHTSHHLELYVNGVPADTYNHAPVATSLFGGNFVLGDALVNGARANHFNGSISQVETWAQTLTPTQIAATAPSDGPVVFPSDSVQYPSGSSWSTGATTVSFTKGQLQVTSAGTPTYTQGTATSANAVLTMQSDGNLVAYPDADSASNLSGALWSSGTAGNAGDVLFLQPSGNLVMHSSDGLGLWSTNTAFADPGVDQWLLTQDAAGSDTAGKNPATGVSVTYGANHVGTANAAGIFNGTSSIATGTGPAMDTSKSFTIAAWVKINNLSSDQMALGQGTVHHQSFYLDYTTGSNGWVFQTTTSDAATTTYPTASSAATAGKWTHLTGVYNASTGTMTLYVNGVASSDLATNTTPQYNTGGPLTIGGVTTVGGNPYEFFNGSVSDVRTYPKALTAAQVKALYEVPPGCGSR